MDAATLLGRLREDYETELSRLGSSKGVYAVTGGRMEGEAVREAAAADAAAAADVFGRWADDEDDPEAAAAFEAVAADAADHREAAGADPDPGADRRLYDYLDGLEATPERLGGLLGRALVAGKTTEQTVGFFVGDADPTTASTFRDVRADVEDHRDRAVETLVAVCEGEADWTAAEEAARGVVEAAYEFYVDTLEGMGVKPKNVC